MKSVDVCSVYAQQNWEMLLRFPVFTFDEFPEKKSDDTLMMWALLSAVFASDHRSSIYIHSTLVRQKISILSDKSESTHTDLGLTSIMIIFEVFV